jgi:hypothetical protein
MPTQLYNKYFTMVLLLSLFGAYNKFLFMVSVSNPPFLAEFDNFL